MKKFKDYETFGILCENGKYIKLVQNFTPFCSIPFLTWLSEYLYLYEIVETKFSELNSYRIFRICRILILVILKIRTTNFFRILITVIPKMTLK